MLKVISANKLITAETGMLGNGNKGFQKVNAPIPECLRPSKCIETEPVHNSHSNLVYPLNKQPLPLLLLARKVIFSLINLVYF